MTDYKKGRKIWLLIFIPAFFIFIVAMLIFISIFSLKSGSGQGGSSTEDNSSMLLVTGVSLVTSFVTAVISFFGLVSSSVLSWRKEKRDKESFDIDNERKKLENEKMKYEIEQLKLPQSKKKSKAKAK